jgi:hypothetical protein
MSTSQREKDEVLQATRNELTGKFDEELEKVRTETAASIAKCTEETAVLQKALDEQNEETAVLQKVLDEQNEATQQYKVQAASALEDAKQETSHTSNEKVLQQHATQAENEKREALAECKATMEAECKATTERALREFAVQAENEKREALAACEAKAASEMQQALAQQQLAQQQQGDVKDKEAHTKALEQCKAENTAALQQCSEEAVATLECKLAELRTQQEAEKNTAVGITETKAKTELQTAIQAHEAHATTDKSIALQTCKDEHKEVMSRALEQCKAEAQESEKKAQHASEAQVDQAVAQTAAKFEQKMSELSSKLGEVEAVFAQREQQALRDAEAAAASDKQAALDALKSECDKEIAGAIADRDEYMALYSQEAKKRRVVHNKLMDMMGNIRVVCRIRPVLAVDCKTGVALVLHDNH